jgi:hypothetical protein
MEKDDEHNELCGGANSYKTTDGKAVFLTQAKSYLHHGPAIANYSQLEFECIVQHQDKAELKNKSTKDHVVNQDQVSTWEEIIHCIHPMLE